MVCSNVDSVKKVPAKGTSGKDMDVGYDPLVRSVDPGVQESDYKYEGTGLNPAHLGVGMGKGIKGDRGVGFHRGNKEPTSGTARTDGVTPGVPSSAAGYENLGRPVRHDGQILDLQSDNGEVMGLEINHAQLGSQEGGGQLNHVQQYIAK